MPRFMNEDEIDEAVARFGGHPVLGRAVRVLSAYRHEVNRKSDGWPYWGHRAAGQLMLLIENAKTQAHYGRPYTVTAAQVTRAIAPVRAFCTSKGLRFPAEAAS